MNVIPDFLSWAKCQYCVTPHAAFFGKLAGNGCDDSCSGWGWWVHTWSTEVMLGLGGNPEIALPWKGSEDGRPLQFTYFFEWLLCSSGFKTWESKWKNLVCV